MLLQNASQDQNNSSGKEDSIHPTIGESEEEMMAVEVSPTECNDACNDTRIKRKASKSPVQEGESTQLEENGTCKTATDYGGTGDGRSVEGRFVREISLSPESTFVRRSYYAPSRIVYRSGSSVSYPPRCQQLLERFPQKEEKRPRSMGKQRAEKERRSQEESDRHLRREVERRKILLDKEVEQLRKERIELQLAKNRYLLDRERDKLVEAKAEDIEKVRQERFQLEQAKAQCRLDLERFKLMHDQEKQLRAVRRLRSNLQQAGAENQTRNKHLEEQVDDIEKVRQERFQLEQAKAQCRLDLERFKLMQDQEKLANEQERDVPLPVPPPWHGMCENRERSPLRNRCPPKDSAGSSAAPANSDMLYIKRFSGPTAPNVTPPADRYYACEHFGYSREK